jgi:hypothetical protein
MKVACPGDVRSRLGEINTFELGRPPAANRREVRPIADGRVLVIQMPRGDRAERRELDL